MDLTLDQAGFAGVLRLVSRAAAGRGAPPGSGPVLLAAADGRLALRAANGELAIATALPAAVAAPGQVAVPLALLLAYAALLPAAPLRLALDAGAHQLHAACGPYRAAFPVLDAGAVPALPEADPEAVVPLDAAATRAAVARVAVAADHTEQHPAFGAVHVTGEDGALALTATDRFRLARARLATPFAGPPLLIPARALQEFARLLSEGVDAQLAPCRAGRGVLLRAGATTIASALVDARFPDAKRLLPSGWDTRVVVAAADFRRAVRLAALAGEPAAAQAAALHPGPGVLRLAARGHALAAEAALPAAVEGASPSPSTPAC